MHIYIFMAQWQAQSLTHVANAWGVSDGFSVAGHRLCARMHLQKDDFSIRSTECWEVASRPSKQESQRGSAAGIESKQMSKSSKAETARTQLGSLTHKQTHTHACRLSRLIGRADKSQADRITHGERLSFRLLRCRPPGSFHWLCVWGDSSLTTSQNRSLATITLLESRYWSRSLQSRVVWGMLLLFLFFPLYCCMTKSAAQGSVTFLHCIDVWEWL